MRVQNNCNTSFKAHFQLEEQQYDSFSYKELKDALASKTGKDILDFIAYIYSDEGKAQLEKLPEDDIVELMLFENNGGETKTYVDPYFHYKSPSMPTKQRLELEYQGLEGKSSTTKDLKKTFIKWSQNLVDFIKK